MLRIILDTSVLVAGLRSRLDAANAVLRLLAEGQIVGLATPPLFLEYEDVLKRPEHQLAHRLSISQLDDLLSELAALMEPVESHFQWRPQARDPSDELVLEAAMNGSADAIVTYNVKDFAEAAARFGVLVVPPGDLLKRLRR